MSWVTFALGLIRDVAATEQGQEIINDLRAGGPKRAVDAAPRSEDEIGGWRRQVNQRLSVTDRNVELLVRMLNAQDEMLVKIQKRQRTWNLALAAAIVILLAAGVLAWLFPGA